MCLVSRRNGWVGRHRYTHNNKQIENSECRHKERHVILRLYVYNTVREDRILYGHKVRNSENHLPGYNNRHSQYFSNFLPRRNPRNSSSYFEQPYMPVNKEAVGNS